MREQLGLPYECIEMLNGKGIRNCDTLEALLSKPYTQVVTLLGMDNLTAFRAPLLKVLTLAVHMNETQSYIGQPFDSILTMFSPPSFRLTYHAHKQRIITELNHAVKVYRHPVPDPMAMNIPNVHTHPRPHSPHSPATPHIMSHTNAVLTPSIAGTHAPVMASSIPFPIPFAQTLPFNPSFPPSQSNQSPQGPNPQSHLPHDPVHPFSAHPHTPLNNHPCSSNTPKPMFGPGASFPGLRLNLPPHEMPPRVIQRVAFSAKIKWNGQRETFPMFKMAFEGHLIMAQCGYAVTDYFIESYKKDVHTCLDSLPKHFANSITRPQLEADCSYIFGALMLACSATTQGDRVLD